MIVIFLEFLLCYKKNSFYEIIPGKMWNFFSIDLSMFISVYYTLL